MKNGKRWYRRWDLDISREEIAEIIRNTSVEDYSVCGLTGPYTPPFSDALVGRSLTFRGEGHVLSYTFNAVHELSFSEDGGEALPVYCQVLTMDGKLFLIQHLVPGAEPARCIDLILDMETGNATACMAAIGTEHSARDVDREFVFGHLDGDFAADGEMHHFTTDMVGRAIIWTYFDGDYEVKHIYTSNLFYTYTMDMPEGAWVASNPADFIKIKDNMYVFSFVEERQPGVQGLFLMDLKNLRDVGGVFGVEAKGTFVSACFGAIGKEVSPTTVF